MNDKQPQPQPDDPASRELQARWQAEKRAVKQLYKDTVKNAKERKGSIHYRVADRHVDGLIEKYTGVVRGHVERYKDQFDAFFKDNKHPVIAFDIEELHGETSCILGIAISPDFNVDVFLASSDTRPSAEQTKVLDRKITAWLKGRGGRPVVLVHGSNQTESKIIKRAGHKSENTQDLLTKILEKMKDDRFKGASIHTFEEIIHFNRVGCSFLKHAKDVKDAGIERKDIAKLFPDQAKLSTWCLASGQVPRTCNLCDKEQDVFMYCLEDSFSTIMIYVHAWKAGVLGKKK